MIDINTIYGLYGWLETEKHPLKRGLALKKPPDLYNVLNAYFTTLSLQEGYAGTEAEGVAGFTAYLMK